MRTSTTRMAEEREPGRRATTTTQRCMKTTPRPLRRRLLQPLRQRQLPRRASSPPPPPPRRRQPRPPHHRFREAALSLRPLLLRHRNTPRPRLIRHQATNSSTSTTSRRRFPRLCRRTTRPRRCRRWADISISKCRPRTGRHQPTCQRMGESHDVPSVH